MHTDHPCHVRLHAPPTRKSNFLGASIGLRAFNGIASLNCPFPITITPSPEQPSKLNHRCLPGIFRSAPGSPDCLHFLLLSTIHSPTNSLDESLHTHHVAVGEPDTNWDIHWFLRDEGLTLRTAIDHRLRLIRLESNLTTPLMEALAATFGDPYEAGRALFGRLTPRLLEAALRNHPAPASCLQLWIKL